MANFDLNSYETVEERLQKYISDNPDFRVVTKVIHHDDNRILIKAYLYDGKKDQVHATGLAEETRGEGYVNKTSHVENCETSAIGRALANAGYSGNKNGSRASRQEMQKVARMTESDSKTQEEKDMDDVLDNAKDTFKNVASDAQKNKIKAMCDILGMSGKQFEDHYFVKWSELTATQASEIIQDLEKDMPSKECPIHKVDMTEKEGKHGKFYSHRLEDGSWCNGK